MVVYRTASVCIPVGESPIVALALSFVLFSMGSKPKFNNRWVVLKTIGFLVISYTVPGQQFEI